jgi:dTDP-4-dehydrorhamnose reductase
VTVSLLIVGARGQLGTALTRLCADEGLAFAALTSSDLDLRDAEATHRAVTDWGLAAGNDDRVVINAASYNAVDDAERDFATAHAINAQAPGTLAAACADVAARLIHVSTDYVFAGNASEPYEVEAPTEPLGVYGRTKRDSERAVRTTLPDASYVVRTAWLYGGVGHNFVKTMIRLEGERATVDVVNDQEGSPTWSRDLASGLLALTTSDATAGTYHATNGGTTTWFGLARAVFEELGADPSRVRPTTSDHSKRPAPRPGYSVLSPRAWNAAGMPPFQPWRDALATAFSTEADALRGRR